MKKNKILLILVAVGVLFLLFLVILVKQRKSKRLASVTDSMGDEFFPCNGPHCPALDDAIKKDKSNRQNAIKASQAIGHDTNGQPYGPMKVLYENGTIKEEGFFENGLLTGVYKTYYSNGNLESEFSYQLGKASGTAKIYYENSIIHYEMMWASGRIQGIRQYDTSGLKGVWTY